ncbi:MAG: SUMF1/EgtB/PvdO family nonheme iron enzyme [Myxococcota bacterium]|nr:SUMF1/EgtB/PvdO family nonheme iron enzyme [Myxococcota bacterium]
MEPTNDGLASFNGPRGGRTLAHELGHNYGRKHIDCGGPDGPHDDPPFDDCDFGVNVPDFEVTHFGFDPVTQTVIKPGDAGELMSYSGDRWISKHNWDRIWNETSTEGGLFAFGAGGNAVGPHVYVYGRADAINGEGELLPAYVLPDGSYDREKVMRSIDAAALIPATSPWTLEVRDGSGGVLFDTMALVFESSDAPDKPAGFAQYLPFPAGAQSVHLLFQGTSVASQTASNSPPQLALDPLSLDVLAQQLQVSWTASDADGDTLRFTIHYSDDDGVSWKLLRLNYGALSATLDTSLLAGSTSARVRVLASDGLNTTEAISPPFILPTHVPTVMIGGVMDGQELPFGSDVQLLGIGVDAEDGSLPGSSLDWNVLGPPDFSGTGSDLTLPDLIPGPYSVDLIGTDSDGDTGSAMLDFSVAPVLIPDTGAPNLDGFCGDGAYRQASAIRMPFGAGGNATARLVHAGTDLYVCVTDLALPFLPFFPASFSLRVEVDGQGDTNPETGDRGFRVDSDGDPFQELVGRSGGFAVTQSPSSGYAARIKSGAESWSAEMRIDEGLLGGWDGLVRMSFRHGNALWPPAHDADSPATYGMVQLGDTAPPLPNLAPVAVTGPDFAVDLVDAGEVHLDGTNSFDADGDPLGFSWSQTGGPPVTLVDADTATPEFALLPSSPAGVYRFELIVDDGSLPSLPAIQQVTVNRADPAPQSSPDLPQLPDFVTVGDPGNDEHPDFRFGAVAEAFQARTTEVTNAEYMMFLQAVARSDPAGLWDPAMGSDPRGGITRSGVDGSFVYAIRPLMMFKPVNFVDWSDAARYVNWLENGSPTAPQGPTTTEDGVYDMSQSTPSRAPGSNYRLPTEDEWFKAAFQDPGAPGGWRQFAVDASSVPTPASVDGSGNVSNSNPDVANYGNFADWNALDGHFTTVGTTLAPSFWGTYDQSGNVSEWTESESRRRGRRVVRGGSFSSSDFLISIEGRSERPDSDSRADLGFRVFRSDTTPPPDSDGDGIPDTADNCTDVPNPGQADANAGQDDDSSLPGIQHYGNACDPDFDDDGLVTPSDFFAGFRPCIGVDPASDPVCAGADFDGDGVVGAADFFGTFRPRIGGAPGPGVGSP